MSRHDVNVTLRQMLDYARQAIAMAHGRSRADLDTDLMLHRALAHTVGIIGEAAGRVPEAYRTQQPDIPWRDIIATRNRLIHLYDRVDLDILWEIVSEDLPRLAHALEPLVPSLPGDEEPE